LALVVFPNVLQTLTARFLAIVDDVSIPCVWDRGQWLIPRYRGIRRETGVNVETGHTLSRSASVRDSAHLQSLLQSGEQLVRQADAANVRPMDVCAAALPLELTNGAIEQPPTPAVQPVFSTSVTGEVAIQLINYLYNNNLYINSNNNIM